MLANLDSVEEEPKDYAKMRVHLLNVMQDLNSGKILDGCSKQVKQTFVEKYLEIALNNPIFSDKEKYFSEENSKICKNLEQIERFVLSRLSNITGKSNMVLEGIKEEENEEGLNRSLTEENVTKGKGKILKIL